MFKNTRRTLLAMLVIPVALSAASVAGATTPQVSSSNSSVADAAVDRDAKVRVGYAGPVNSLDPHLATLATWQVYDFLVYDRLWEVDDNLQLVPQLASEWKFADDGSYLDVVMRDDAQFHDGSPVNAEAVKASIERAQTLEASTVANLVAGITSVEVIDEYTVRFNLAGSGAETPAILATNAGAIMNPAVIDDPGADLDEAPPIGAGSGPYVVTESEASVSTTWERAPEYWDPTAGNLAEISITFVPAASTRLAALQAGDFDLVQVTGVDLATAHADADAGRYRLYSRNVNFGYDLLLNSDRGDLANPDIRRAIALGVNREEIGTDLLGNCIVNTQPYNDAHWAHNPDIEYTYDPDTAAQLVADAGGASFEITYAAGSSYEPIAIAIQGQLNDLGFDVALRPGEQATVNPPFFNGERDALVSSITPAPDPTVTIGQYFTGGYNIARSEYAVELSELAAEASDPSLAEDDRSAIFQDLFQTVTENNLYVPICRPEQAWAHTLDFVNLDDTPGIGLGLPNFTRLAVAEG